MCANRPAGLFALLVACLQSTATGAVSCTGEDGVAVDWWLALKSPGTDITGNTKYGYLDSASKQERGAYVWRQGTQISGTAQNPPADTLAPLYESNSTSIGYVLWNDEPGTSHCSRGCTSFILAHSKGVLGFSSSGGFLLSHSVPKYPDSPKDAAFGGIQVGQTLNGQSFLCISLDPEGLEAVATKLQSADLNIFSPHFIPSHLAAKYPNIARLAESAPSPWGPVKEKAVIESIDLRSAGGEQLRLFVKSSTGGDGEQVRMWEDVVEPGLASGMWVQSWPEGRTKDMPSYCGPPESDYESLIVSDVSIPGTNLSWATRASGRYHDHSKWGITAPSSDAAIYCAGDNNRANHQSVRGGSAICFTRNAALHTAISNAVAGTSPCSSLGDPLFVA